ncbi:MAG: signal recognition particle-docking protein FtsY [Actinomycetota bacterium]
MDPLLVAAVAALVVLAVGGILVARRRSRRGGTARPPHIATAAAPRADGLGAGVKTLLAGREPERDDWARLEDLLVRADVGPATAADIVSGIRDRFTPDADPESLVSDEIVSLLGGDAILDLPAGRLAVIMVVGVNGTGKTTTIGKLAHLLAAGGRKVCVAGSDTFRAAASEQLSVWAERAGAHLVSQERGADPGAVAFDAVRSAGARGMDVVIVDTAGRLHTRAPLMDELRKVKRVLEKAAGQVDETLLVLDATTGQNGIAQARAFTEAVGVTGVALTKLDGTAGGGIVLAIREELGVPVKLVGTGEGLEDLEPFEAKAFAERMLRG